MMTRAALLIVDVQKGFVNGFTAHIPLRVESLQRDYPLTFATKFINSPSSFYAQLIDWHGCMPHTEDVEMAFRVAPRTKVIEKSTYSVVNDEFVASLRSAGLKEIHICGIDTDVCVMKCAVDLFERGIRPIVLANYCASHAGPEYHDMALRILRRYIGGRQIDDSTPAVLADPD